MDEIDIWRAAKQMLTLYPNGAELAAAMRANKALDQGDMFNFELWKRIAKATRELERDEPKPGEAVN